MAPLLILLFSGKRKSGKDFITDRLQTIIGDDNCTILKISEPIKSYWAKMQNLDLAQLLGDGAYKETYRLRMIEWSEDMRAKDYGCFCQLACESAKDKTVWIVSDIRRRTDIKWFKKTYGPRVRTVKVIADEDVRTNRGWIFTPGIDDAPSECDLDGVTDWDFTIYNNDVSENLHDKLIPILSTVNALHVNS